MMRKEYTKFNAIKFSTDFYFLQWRIAGDSESAKFWINFINENPEKKVEIDAAIRIIDSIRINDYRFTDDELHSEWMRIQASIPKYSGRRVKMWRCLAIASCFAILLGFHYISNIYNSSKTGATYMLAKAEKNDEIRLVLGDNSSISFNQNTDFTYDKTGNIVVSNMTKEKIISQKKIIAGLQPNKLIVPKGKRSSLILSDGSKIWINSGSTLQFPSKFAPNRREIGVDGEIYIEVSKDANRPFIVKTSRFEVKVLGTKFNVSAYKEDAKNEVALVEGSVKVMDKLGRKTNIKPNELLTVSANNFHKEYVDVYNYISWKDGIFRFVNEPLKNILIRLSRYYNISIDCADDIRDINISGKLVLFDNPEMALNSISIIIPVKYKNDNGKIIFSKKTIK